MLTRDPNRLARMISEAESDRDQRLDKMKEREQIALGRLRMDPGENLSPENLALTIYQAVSPSMVTQSPIVRWRSSGGQKSRLQASAVTGATTQIARKQKIHLALEPSAWDFFFKHFCAGFIEKPVANMNDLTKEERRKAVGRMHPSEDEKQAIGNQAADDMSPRAAETPNQPMKPRWPRMVSLDPRRCGWDSRGRTIAEARFTWHEVREDRDDLLARAKASGGGWDHEAIKALPQNEYEGQERQDGTQYTSRDEVRYYVIYCPGESLAERPPEPDEPGVIYTLGYSGMGADGTPTGSPLRRAFYWKGHPSGCHVFAGNYTTGESSHFLSMLAGFEDANGMLEAVSASVHERIRNHKRVYAYDLGVEAEVENLMKAEDGEFIGVPRLSQGAGMIQDIETSALSPAEAQEYALMQQSASRKFGMEDEEQGRASDKTATAVRVAAAKTGRKLDYLVKRWYRFVGEGMERMAWEVAHDDRVIVRMDDAGRESYIKQQLQPLEGLLGREAIQTITHEFKQRPKIYQGGDFAVDGALDWFSLDLWLEPFSMDEQYGEVAFAREVQANEQLAMLANQMRETPFIRWSDRIKRTMEALGVYDVEEMVDPDMLEQFVQMAMLEPSQNATVGSETPQQDLAMSANTRFGGGGGGAPQQPRTIDVGGGARA